MPQVGYRDATNDRLSLDPEKASRSVKSNTAVLAKDTTFEDLKEQGIIRE